jgi:hypothetical protein
MSKLDDIFGAWLKVVLPDSGTAERDQRLGIIRTFSGTIGKENITDLVLAFYSAATDSPTAERLRSEMRDIDTSFGPKDDAELAVIATGVLFEIIEKGGDLAAATALTILCADFGALADRDHVAELVTSARKFIGKEGIRIREESVKLPNLAKALQSALVPEDVEKDEEEEEAGGEEAGGEEAEEEEEAQEEAQEEEDKTDAESSLRRVIDVIADFGDQVEQSLTSIEARRAEQSDILYWLLSGRRHIADLPLKGLNKEEAAIFIAIELAALTRQIPGPASASAILSTLLDQCKNPSTNEVTLEACVRSIDPTDGGRYLAKRNVVHPVITPISFALVKAEENGWKNGWENAVTTQTQKTANTKYPVLIIAEQLYREALLARVLGEK